MSPVKAQALLQEGLTHHKAGRFGQAFSLYAEVCRSCPRNFDALHLNGVALLQAGQPAEAIEWLGKALRLNPRSPTTLMCLGLAHSNLGRQLEAEIALKKSVEFDPSSSEAWSHLAAVHVLQDRLEASAQCYRQSVTLNPKFADGWTALGSVLLALGRIDEALEAHTRALTLDPRHPRAHSLRAQAEQARHHVQASLADFEEHLRLNPSDLEARSLRLFLLHYLPYLTPKQLFDEHVEFGRLATKAIGTPFRFPPDPQPERKLRVAFISPDLRLHSVSYFLQPIIDHLDRSSFEIVLYHDHFRSDAASERLRAKADLWRNFVGQTPESVEAIIRSDAPDILIELAGHTGLNRLKLLAKRLAPVQITYLGYPDTRGVPAIDYRFTDERADPPGESDAFATEKLVRFSSTAWVYSPPKTPPTDTPPPSTLGRPIAFGSFNSLSKTNPYILGLWSELLRSIPQSRLVLKCFGLTSAVILPRLQEAGIDASRVDLLAPTAPNAVAEHLTCYAQVDVALDPFPYHGTTTTCEALWMGVPVVSLRGDRHCARVGVSLLSAIGHPEWIADTPSDYLSIAKNLATDPARLAALRRSLRTEMKSSPLMDEAGQATRFGNALRECWRAWSTPSARSRPAALAV